MWLLSMNQRHCGSALPFFLLCFLEHPGVTQPQQSHQGWRLGPLPSSHTPPPVKWTKGGQPWVTEIPQKGGSEEENETRRLLGEMGRKIFCGATEPNWDAAACAQHWASLGDAVLSPSPCPPSWPTTEGQPSCLHQLSPYFSLPSPTSPHLTSSSCSQTQEHHCKRGARQSQKPSKGRASLKNREDKA